MMMNVFLPTDAFADRIMVDPTSYGSASWTDES